MSIAERDVATQQRLVPVSGGVALRREALGLLALVVVAASAAGFAHVFRATSLGLVHLMWGSADPTRAAGQARTLAVVAAVATALALAVWIGRRAARGRSDRLGIAALATAARGEGRGPSLRGTLVRAGATWMASAGLASLGRENAIIETGGAVGSALGRRLGRLGPALAAGGIGAGFAAAYHAPIAGALYVEEHLRVRRDPRSAAYAVLGSAIGHLVSVRAFDGHRVLSGTQGSGFGLVVLALVGLVPSAAGARVFLELRERATRVLASGGPAGTAPGRARGRTRAALLVAAAALLVALVPLTSGNGAEALRHAALEPTLGLALALGVGKLLATTAAFGSGAPGGAFSPTLSVSAGWALLSYLGLEALGVNLPGAHWDGMLVAMAVGVAVGLRAPLVAVFVVPEMTGQLGLIPLFAVAVLAGTIVDKQVDRWRRRAGHRVPAELHDEDG